MVSNFKERLEQAMHPRSQGGIPVYPTPERAARALAALCAYREFYESK